MDSYRKGWSMSAALPKSDQKISQDTTSATFSQGSEVGPGPSDSPESRQISLFGQVAAPASPSAPPESAPGRQMTGISGISGSSLSEFADRMSLLANRLRRLLPWDGSTEYSMTWSRRDTKHGRVYYQLAASGRRTSEPGCSGLASGWTTPSAVEPDGSTHRPSREATGRTTDYLGRQVHEIAGWRSPTATDGTNGGPNARDRTGHPHLSMEAQLAGWPTPKTPTGGGQEVRTTPGGGLRKLEDAVIQCAGWATASSRDWKDTPGMAQTGTNPDGSERERLDQLPRQVTGLMPSPSSAGTEKPGESLRLNPAFSGWLMGYPREWILAGLRAHFHLRGKSKGAYGCSGGTETPSSPRLQRRFFGRCFNDPPPPPPPPLPVAALLHLRLPLLRGARQGAPRGALQGGRTG